MWKKRRSSSLSLVVAFIPATSLHPVTRSQNPRVHRDITHRRGRRLTSDTLEIRCPRFPERGRPRRRGGPRCTTGPGRTANQRNKQKISQRGQGVLLGRTSG